jgi:hypothetical protein
MLSGEELHSQHTYIVFFNGIILGVHRRPQVCLSFGFSEFLTCNQENLIFYTLQWLNAERKLLILPKTLTDNYLSLSFQGSSFCFHRVSSKLSQQGMYHAAVCRDPEEIATRWQDWRICQHSCESWAGVLGHQHEPSQVGFIYNHEVLLKFVVQLTLKV